MWLPCTGQHCPFVAVEGEWSNLIHQHSAPPIAAAAQFNFSLLFSVFHSYSGFRTLRQTAAAEFKETGDSYFKYDKRQPLSL